MCKTFWQHRRLSINHGVAQLGHVYRYSKIMKCNRIINITQHVSPTRTRCGVTLVSTRKKKPRYIGSAWWYKLWHLSHNCMGDVMTCHGASGIWYDMVWYEVMMWYMMWYGMIYDVVYDMVWYGIVWYSMVWYGIVWYMVWYHIWYDMVYHKASDRITYMVLNDMIYGTIWYTIWYHMFYHRASDMTRASCEMIHWHVYRKYKDDIWYHSPGGRLS